VRSEAPPVITIAVSRADIIQRVLEHSRMASWNGSWALELDPATGRHGWFWAGRFPPPGTHPPQQPHPGWRVLVLPRVDASKLTVDARKDRVEDWVWEASAEGTLEGWIEAGEPQRAGFRLKIEATPVTSPSPGAANAPAVSNGWGSTNGSVPTVVVSRADVIRRVLEHSRMASWNGSWALELDPATGRHGWFWAGRFPPVGTNPPREPHPGWRVLILPRVDATKLMVDARKDRVEDWVWEASAEGTLDGWIEAGEPQRAGVALKFV
jgi:hypothetical protein